MKNFKYKLIVLLAATVFAGCTLETPFTGESCGNKERPLAYISYGSNICDAEHCSNKSDCCGEPDSSMRDLLFESFQYSRCPDNSSFSVCGDDGGKFYCSSGCAAGTTACGGQCLNFDMLHIQSCEDGILICGSGYADCDGAQGNGCELNVSKLHVVNCLPDGIVCEDGFADCDGDRETGCETSVRTDPYNCGACNAVCDSNPFCREGICSDSCPTGTVVCDSMCLSLAALNIEHCSPGSKILDCADNYENCDYEIANGCEAGLLTDAGNCGACGHSCDNGEICVEGECATNTCPPETPDYCMNNGIRECIDAHDANVHNCGACGYDCTKHPIQNATSATCDKGQCLYECVSGYVQVSSSATADSIQCVDPYTDPNYCGATSFDSPGQKCGSGEACVSGRCIRNTCTPPETLCDIEGDHSCIDINGNDADHCGACNYKCAAHAIPNAESSVCESGFCQYECSLGYVNISTGTTSSTIKCVDPLNDNNYCGAQSASSKGEKCGNGFACVNGECVVSSCTDDAKPDLCVSGGVSICVNLNASDAENCGMCGNVCADHPIQNATSDACHNGQCQYECKSGYVNVSSGATAGTINCINPDSDNQYCGAKSASDKGVHCNVGEACVSGTCVITSCSGSTPDLCLEDGQNVCRNVNSTDDKNCGSCGHQCSASMPADTSSASCSGGVCQYTCKTGYVNVGLTSTETGIRCIDPLTNDSYCGAEPGNIGNACTGNLHCYNGRCAECGSDAQCSTLLPHCDLSTNTCVLCTADAHCISSRPYCTSDNQCVACITDAHCSGSTPYCNAMNRCVACTENAHCSGSTPYCDTLMNRCGACTEDAHCTAEHSECNQLSMTCQCVSGYVSGIPLSELVCVEDQLACASNADCSSYAHAVCGIDNRCVCDAGYFDQAISDNKLLCTLNECSSDNDCPTNATCFVGVHECVCAIGYTEKRNSRGKLISCLKELDPGCGITCTDGCICNTVTGMCEKNGRSDQCLNLAHEL